MKTTILGIIVALFTLAGCIKEDLDPCPAGNVRMNIYAEKFQNISEDPMLSTETDFKGRMSHLRYFLYQGDVLKDQGIVRDFSGVNGAFYTLSWQNLDFGDYRLVLVGNSTANAMTGDGSVADNLLLTYPGADLTEDYFSAVFPFTVDCNCTTDFNVGLSRMQGVVRYTFKNVPADLTDIEIGMTGVTAQKHITGDYEGAGNATHRHTILPVRAVAGPDFSIGIFPTLPDKKAVFSMKLYRNHEPEPYYDRMVTDTLRIRRNQLLEIGTTFSDGEVFFEIKMDASWDGSTPGGDTEIN